MDISFSIIMPTFNRKHCIKNAIDSLLAQTYKNYELIVIDDGSIDGTEEYLFENYKKELKNEKIKFIKFKKNNGVCVARNEGIKTAKNEWIGYLDTDNVMYSDYLKTFAKFINKNTGSKNFYAQGKTIQEGFIFGNEFDFEKLIVENFIDLNVFIHHKDLFKQYGGFDVDLKRAVDWDLIIRYTKDNPAFFIKKILLDYDNNKNVFRISTTESLADAYKKIILKYYQTLPNEEFVAKYRKIFQNNTELSENLKNKESELSSINELINQKNVELQQKNIELQQKNEEIVLIKSSKFWKLRELNFKIKFVIFSPLSFFKKYNKKLKNLYKQAVHSFKRENLQILILRTFNYIVYGKGVLNKEEIMHRKKGSDFGEIVFDLKNIDYNFKPKVTVIVPNYNHEKYLRQRLDSIYSQSYSNFNVILLDDNSSDKSRDILLEYADKYKKNTRYIFNQANSGSVFNQWKKGIEEADGEFIWIAESDDYCSDNLISSIVPFFSNESVMIAYCRSIFKTNNKKTWDIESYLADIDENKWKTDFIETSHVMVNLAMAKKNVIPNMSSAIFRNPGKMNLLNDEKWKNLRFCGDWVFYLHIMRGGAIAYTTKATNYYRQHDKNTSTKLQNNDIYYIEHEFVAMTVAELYAVPSEIFDKQYKMLYEYWNLWHKNGNKNDFNRCYNIEKIKNNQKNRKTNIAMFGYSFAAGGGETFPIILANILHDNGYGVTFINCDRDTRVEGVRNMLKQSIPVVKLIDAYRMPLFVNALGVEILHSQHAWVDSTINQMIDYMPKCKHIVTLHGMYEMTEDEILEKILPSLSARVDKWVYTTDKNIEAFKRFNYFNKEKFVKIGNALVRVGINPILRDSLNIEKNAFVFCLVSRSVPEKGWEEAIRCVGQARSQSGKDIQLIIIGDGEEKERLQRNAVEYVHFLGFKSNIRDYYAMSDMGILPSRFKGESFPLTIIDCLFAGKPIMASNIAEIKNMLKVEDGEYAGALFDLNDWIIPEKELTELIIKCATDIKYYNAMLSEVNNAANKFDLDNVFLKYRACYDELCDVNK